MKLLIVFAVCVAVAMSSPVKTGYQTQQTVHKPSVHTPDVSGYNSKLAYHGEYRDTCDHDGFYYRDADTFVICSNNNAYVQRCAPGSRNSPIDKYTSGGAYSQRDFCDVNLNDIGYADNHYNDNRDDSYAPRYDDVDRYNSDRYYDNDRRDYGYGGRYYDDDRYYGNNGRFQGRGRRYYGGYDRYNRHEYGPDDRFYGNNDRYYGNQRHY